ncbi:MAG: Flp family type IVb pilin [Roseinatronobacter sp.]
MSHHSFQFQLQNFLRHEDGTVTVDWIVLTVAIVGIGLAAKVPIQNGVETLATGIETSLSSATFPSLGCVSGGPDTGCTSPVGMPVDEQPISLNPPDL